MGSLLQAGAYALWTAAPGYTAFAIGFVVWGLGGAFTSGALEALLYDGLASVGAEDYYPRISSRVTAVGLLCQLPTAVAATLLFATGGYALVGWASVALCLAGAAVATRLPEHRPPPTTSADRRPGDTDADADSDGDGDSHAGTDNQADRDADADSEADSHAGTDNQGDADTDADADADVDIDDGETGYLTILRNGVREAARNPAVRVAVVAVAVLGGLDGIDEYFPLFARDWGIDASLVPMAMVGIPLAGAAGAALGGPASRLRPRSLTLMMALAVGLFCGAALLHRPVGMAGVSVAYGLYQLVLVVTNARLQARIVGPSRATVTSVASLGTELSAAVLVGAWAIDRPWLVAGVAVAVTAALPRLLRDDIGTEPIPGGVAVDESGPR